MGEAAEPLEREAERTVTPVPGAIFPRPPASRLPLAQLFVIAVGLLLFRLKWPHLRDFVVAIDHGDVLFADFVNHYYPTVAGSLRNGAPAGGFFYPAGFAALLAPIGMLPRDAALAVWGTLELGCVLWVATSLVREVVRGRPLLAVLGTALVVSSVPVLHNLKWGQVSLLILTACAGAFLLYQRGRWWPAAALLGIAAGIKGYPIVMLAWFVVRGDYRFVLRAAAAAAVTLVVLPAILMGPSHALFFQRVSTGAVMGAADGVLRDFNSQYAPAVLSRYFGGWDATAADVRAMGELGAAGTLVLTAALLFLVAHGRSARLRGHRDWIALVLLSSTVPFWLRTSWTHYFVHLPIAQLLLARLCTDGTARSRFRDGLAIAVFVAPSVFLSNVLGLFATEGWWYYANAGSLFFANALVLAGFTAIVVEAELPTLLSPRELARRPTARQR